MASEKAASGVGIMTHNAWLAEAKRKALGDGIPGLVAMTVQACFLPVTCLNRGCRNCPVRLDSSTLPANGLPEKASSALATLVERHTLVSSACTRPALICST